MSLSYKIELVRRDFKTQRKVTVGKSNCGQKLVWGAGIYMTMILNDILWVKVYDLKKDNDDIVRIICSIEDILMRSLHLINSDISI